MTVWHYQGWVRVFVEGEAIHTSSHAVPSKTLPPAGEVRRG